MVNTWSVKGCVIWVKYVLSRGPGRPQGSNHFNHRTPENHRISMTGRVQRGLFFWPTPDLEQKRRTPKNHIEQNRMHCCFKCAFKKLFVRLESNVLSVCPVLKIPSEISRVFFSCDSPDICLRTNKHAYPMISSIHDL